MLNKDFEEFGKYMGLISSTISSLLIGNTLEYGLNIFSV